MTAPVPQLMLLMMMLALCHVHAARVASAFAWVAPNQHPAAATTAASLLRLSATTRKTEKNDASAPASSLATGRVVRQTVVLDGAEWTSVRNRLALERGSNPALTATNPDTARTPSSLFGVCTAVTGSLQGRRVVAMQAVVAASGPDGSGDSVSDSDKVVQLDQGIPVYAESVAEIPPNKSERDAAWTLLQALSAIHCALPVLQNVGGSNDNANVMGVNSSSSKANAKIVVVGGGELAVTAATALAKLGCDVTLVSDRRPANLNPEVRHLPPAVGELELGFCSAVGQFDSLLDTLGSEHGSDSTTALLASRHGCHNYVSTFSASQNLVGLQGLVWGPGKAREHAESLRARANKATAAHFVSPSGFGKTVQSLMVEAGVTLPAPKEAKESGSVFVRGWSLKDFWEAATWPRDAEAQSVRYGLPSASDELQERLVAPLLDENGNPRMISAPPFAGTSYQPVPEVSDEGPGVDSNDNPYVLGVDNVGALQEKVVEARATCLLFLSAPWCRTCRYLKPKYQRMAQKYAEAAAELENEATTGTQNVAGLNDVAFVKAEARGAAGKELGKALGVDSVPTFVMFKKGKVFGKPLSVSRIPSKTLDLAVLYLQEDRAWNEAAFFSVSEDSSKEGGGSGGYFRGGTGQAPPPDRKKLF